MPADLNYLTTAAQCDEAIAYANKVKGDLEFELEDQSRDSADKVRLTNSVADGLTETNVQLNYINANYAALPEGPFKRKQLALKERLEGRKAELERRGANYGSDSKTEAVLDVLRLEAELASITQFIADVTARKAAL